MRYRTKPEMMNYINTMIETHGNTVIPERIYLYCHEELRALGLTVQPSVFNRGLFIVSVSTNPQNLQVL